MPISDTLGMDRIDTYPMALDETPPPKTQANRPWAADVSRPWAETLPGAEPLAATARGGRAVRVAKRLVTFALFGLVAYLLRGAFLA